MNGQRAKPWLVMSLIFVIGIVTGVALTFEFRADWLRPPGEQQIRSHWLKHLTERLNLTPDQQAKINPILIDAGNQIQHLHGEELERMSHIMQEANDKISPLLTAGQQAELKEMENERRRVFSGHMRSWGAPHGHHDPDDEPPRP